ncbi:uncharacterized protein METZ01_LOCUS485084, partial [marine metagenome]
MKHIFSVITILSTLSQAQIAVNPSTLDFGNVLMGNSPSVTFTVTGTLAQTVTITPPTNYSLSDSAIVFPTATSSDSTITVTFSPPQVGN